MQGSTLKGDLLSYLKNTLADMVLTFTVELFCLHDHGHDHQLFFVLITMSHHFKSSIFLLFYFS